MRSILLSKHDEVFERALHPVKHRNALDARRSDVAAQQPSLEPPFVVRRSPESPVRTLSSVHGYVPHSVLTPVVRAVHEPSQLVQELVFTKR